MGSLIGGAAAGLGGAYLQKRAQNNATKQQNALIQQQATRNNYMTAAYLNDYNQLTSSYRAGLTGITASAAKAKKQVAATLPFPKKSPYDTGSVGKDMGTAYLGRSALVGS